MIECGGLHAFGKLTDSPVDEHCKDAVWAISNIAVSDHSPCSKYGTSFKLLALITSNPAENSPGGGAKRLFSSSASSRATFTAICK